MDETNNLELISTNKNIDQDVKWLSSHIMCEKRDFEKFSNLQGTFEENTMPVTDSIKKESVKQENMSEYAKFVNLESNVVHESVINVENIKVEPDRVKFTDTENLEERNPSDFVEVQYMKTEESDVHNKEKNNFDPIKINEGKSNARL